MSQKCILIWSLFHPESLQGVSDLIMILLNGQIKCCMQQYRNGDIVIAYITLPQKKNSARYTIYCYNVFHAHQMYYNIYQFWRCYCVTLLKKQQLYTCQFTLSVQSILGPCVESLYIKVWDFPTSPVPLGLQNQQYNRLVAFQKYSILQFVSGIVCTFCVHYTHMLHVYMNV